MRAQIRQPCVRHQLVWCLRSSFKKSNDGKQVKSNSNPPWSPFFQRGNFFRNGFNPSLEKFGKEGKGRFSRGEREFSGDLLGQDTSFALSGKIPPRCRIPSSVSHLQGRRQSFSR